MRIAMYSSPSIHVIGALSRATEVFTYVGVRKSTIPSAFCIFQHRSPHKKYNDQISYHHEMII